MTHDQFSAAIRSLSDEQFEAVRVCIMAERRLRFLYPRHPEDGGAIVAAYAWAMSAKPEPMPFRGTSSEDPPQ